MIVNSLKGHNLYLSLENYNSIIDQANKGFVFSSEAYDINKNEGSFWFDPKCVRDLAISSIYPACLPVQKDEQFSLYLYAPNYFSLLLINELYKDKKNILIEESCGGRGDFLMYLNKLGFDNFHMIDNFTQLPKNLYENLMKLNNLTPKLNDFSCVPTIINHVGYTYFIKPIHSDTELIITYNNTRLITKKEDGSFKYLHQNLEEYTDLPNMVCLAIESHGLAKAYCKKEKLEEFTEKLKTYEVEL